MPVIYEKYIIDNLHSIDLALLKSELALLGYDFVREGNFDCDKEPFTFCNYLFYQHPVSKIQVRIGYDYGLGVTKDLIFEICYSKQDDCSWRDVTPDFRKNKWKKISRKYVK